MIDGTDIDLSATAGEFPALLCEFKTDIATYLKTYVHGTNPKTGQPYPQTLAELIEFNEDHPDLEGPWNDLVFELAEATNGRDAECAGIRAGVDAAGAGGDRRPDGRARPRRDHRADQRAGLADQLRPRRGRPRRPLRVLRRLVGGGCSVGLRRHHGARGAHPQAPDGDHLHRRPLVRAGAARPCVRLRAGDAIIVARRSSRRRSAMRCSPACRTRRSRCGSRRRRRELALAARPR